MVSSSNGKLNDYKKYSKQHKVKEFLDGENASLRIPRIDRTCSDMLRLPCVIVQITGEHHSLYITFDAVQVYVRGVIMQMIWSLLKVTTQSV